MSHPRPQGVEYPTHTNIKIKEPLSQWFFYFRAGKGTRTLDPDLGKVVLYQLSYSRGVSHI